MTPDIAGVFAIVSGALVLFALEPIPADLIALGVLLTLIVTGLLPPEEAFASFGSEAVLLIFGLLILNSALIHTGVANIISRAIMRRTGDSPRRTLIVITVAAALLSALMSNTVVTALFVPITLALARVQHQRASRLLLPLAFSAILSSSITLISSSTNIIVSGLMVQSGLSPLGLFELAPVGIPVAVIGAAYMLTIGRHLTPVRDEPGETEDRFGIRRYLTEALVLPRSPLAGKTLAESRLGHDLDLTVVRVVRERERYLTPQADLQLHEGDVLLVLGHRDEVLHIKDTVGLAIRADVELSLSALEADDVRLVEAILLRPSPLIGKTLKQVRFRQRYGPQILGISRRGHALLTKIGDVTLRTGDQLLVQGHRQDIARLDENNTFRVIGAVDHRSFNTRHAVRAGIIFTLTMLAGASGIAPLPVTVLLGALIAMATGCITSDEAYRRVEWRTLIVIAGMLALSRAMVTSGAANLLATTITGLIGPAHPLWLLTAFFALTLLLTQPLSNQAAAAVTLPIAMQAALHLNLNPRTFAVMIAIAASCSFLTPLEPSCLMVYGPGRYRFTDFLKVGTPLTLLIYLLALLLVPRIWPL